MKAAFIFDTVLYKEDNKYYGMTLTYNFFTNKYLRYFEQIQVCTRCIDKKFIKGDISGYKRTDGKKVLVTPIQNYNDIPDAILNKKKINKELEKIINNSDVVIIRMPSVLGIFASKIAKKMQKPYLVEMVACAWDGYMNHARFGGKVLAPIMYLNTRKCVYQAPYVIYVTEQFLQKRYPNNNKNIACSDVVLQTLNENILNKRINKIEKFEGLNNLKLCTVANVGLKYKGQKYILKAMKYLKCKNIYMDYFLIGNGNSNKLMKLSHKYGISNQINFVGSLSHDKIFKKLDEMDIYIQPSLQEGLPRALVEAMSRALPCIGTNAGGIPELLDSKFIFKKRKYKKLVLILSSLTKEKLIESSRCNFNVANKFDKNVLDKKIDKFYDEILNDVRMM